MASGWQALGDVLGGGIDTAGAYETGRLRTAQTEGALAAAREHQLKSMSLEFQAKNQLGMESALIAAGRDPKEAHLIATVANGGLGADFNSTVQGLGHQQENDFRATLGDPKAPLADQFAAGQGVQGKVLSPYEQVAPQTYVDLRAPGAAGAPAPLQVTPIGNASIRADDALAYQRMHPEISPSGQENAGLDPYHGVYGKPKLGEMANPNFNPQLPASVDNMPFIERPIDPNVASPMGSRERMQVSTVVHSLLENSQRLKTIMDMPSGANAGIMGTDVGGRAGVSVFQAVSNNLKWALAPEEVNIYNTVMQGQARNLAILENFGRAPTEGQIQAIQNALSLKADGSETILGKMMKMADYRNTVENAANTFLAMYEHNPTTPPDVIAKVKESLTNVQTSVPFTMDDVVAMQAKPGLTIKEAAQQRRLNAPAGAKPAAPAAPTVPPSPGAPAVGLDQDGWMDMGGGVRVRLKPGQ